MQEERMMTTICHYEVKTLKGEIVLLQDMSLDATVHDLYREVAKVESTPDGKWKLMLMVQSPRTLKPSSDMERQLSEYGVKQGQTSRVEVILDMGACHTSCKRI